MTDEQRGLLAMAGESLRAARLLAGQNLNRFAVSRAYYAMFYCAEAVLLSKGLTYSKYAGVIASFGKEFAKTEELPPELHRHLIEAAEMREDGDYDYAAVITDEECLQQLRRAEAFLRCAATHIEQHAAM